MMISMLNLFAIMMVIAEVKRRYFLKFLSRNWPWLALFIICQYAAMTLKWFLKHEKWDFIIFIW
jgi:hypothetical protein